MYVCNVAMATGRVAILVNTCCLQFQSLSNDRYDVIKCEWNDKVLLVSLVHRYDVINCEWKDKVLLVSLIHI